MREKKEKEKKRKDEWNHTRLLIKTHVISSKKKLTRLTQKY